MKAVSSNIGVSLIVHLLLKEKESSSKKMDNITSITKDNIKMVSNRAQAY
jgi:hypothetical protein